MVFRFYSNAVSQATKGIATGILMVGLLLIGFGMLILAMPEVFALLAAVVFFIGGLGCGFTALRIYLALRQIDRMDNDTHTVYRKNVRIHSHDRFDI